MVPFWRLELPFRYAIYAVFTLLFLSGAAWLLADQLKEESGTELWQQVSAYSLMIHGGTAMLALLLLGALFPVHIGRAWQAKKNRLTGSTMVASNAMLIATAFGIYYLGQEELRPWASDIHIVVGMSLPLLLLLHIKAGRKRP
jgi:hypothetical protein